MARAFTPGPNLLILGSTLLWGTLWIPLRRMHEEGLAGATATAAGFLLPLLLLLPGAWRRRRSVLGGGSALWGAGFFLAASIALYAEGLVRGQVARVLLLFYLTPVWSTLLARWLLAEPIRRSRIATIVLGLAGMLVIFGAHAGIPWPRERGEWMGLAAGGAWAVAMVQLNRSAARPLFDRVFVPFLFLGPLFLLLTGLPGRAGGLRLDPGALVASGPWLLAFALLWMLPVLWLTILGASRLDPGRVSILLMFEIVVGLTTATWLTDEPLGPREILGALLVTAASGAEVTAARRPARGGRALGGGRSSPGGED